MMRFKRKGFHLLTLVIVVLLIYPGSLAAKKKGAHLQVEKQDGQVIEGELLRVKENSLLVMTSASGNGVTIDINEIEKIMVKRKSEAGKGALWGALIGVGGGAVLGVIWGNALESEGANPVFGAAIGGIVFGGVGALTGQIIGAMIPGGYKTIQVKGKSPSEIKKIMEKLKKKARFKT